MTDQEIIALYWARDEQAIRQTQAIYSDALYGLSFRILGNHEDSQENESDTYLKTWNSIPPVRPQSLFSYLMKICRNGALTRLTRSRAKKRSAELVSLTKELEDCIPDNRFEEQLSLRALSEALNRFLSGLSREARAVFLSRFFEARSIPEIAEDFGLSEGNVRTILWRTRRQLKKHLESEEIWI